MYVGIDIAKKKSQMCIINQDRKVVVEFEIMNDKKGYEHLNENLTKDMKIGLEITGNYCKTLFNYLKTRYDVSYVDNLQMKNFAKLNYTYVKNDKVDAKLIALYMSYNFKKIHPIKVDELKDLSRLYQKSMKQLVRYKFMFKDQTNIIFPELEKKVSLRSYKGIVSLLLEYPTPKQISEADSKDIRTALIKNLQKSSIFTTEYVRKLKNMAKDSVGVKDYPVSFYQYTIRIMIFYQNLINDLKIKMKECLMKTPYYSLLDEFGYSEVNLSTIVGEVGDIRRFSNHKKFVSYCGFDVSEKKSDEYTSSNSFITKQGNKILRVTFCLATIVNLRYKTEFADFYNRLKEKGKHPKKCMIATARKLAVRTYFDLMKCHD